MNKLPKKVSAIIANMSPEERSEMIQRIVSLRKNNLHHSQQEFANYCGISQSYLSMLESGRKPLTQKAFKKIVEASGVSSIWLLYGITSDSFMEKSPKEEVNNFVNWFQSLPLDDQVKIAQSIKHASIFFQSHPIIGS
ncbi:helix-turn-helix domain-containing protein [[Clostridium] aminophilum]|uniref:helix-turn-helix domain-containing protein n=1 Tax=[Clostridium] aminophilum TaxID=1526 RepID=UPI003F9721E9